VIANPIRHRVIRLLAVSLPEGGHDALVPVPAPVLVLVAVQQPADRTVEINRQTDRPLTGWVVDAHSDPGSMLVKVMELDWPARRSSLVLYLPPADENR